MSNEIFYHRYSLRSSQELNAASSKLEHQGMLIKVGDGYGCIHPWPELGDAPLEKQLEALQNGSQTRLLSHAKHCAKIDGEARQKGVSLFSGLNIPKSHATIVGGMDAVEDAVNRGFDTVKLKVGRDSQAEVAMVNAIAEKWNLKLRLDFNCKLAGSEVERFVLGLTEKAQQSIEFLEDPCGYKDKCWSGIRSLLGIRLAMDIGVEEVDALYGYGVIKPAKNNVEKVVNKMHALGRRAVITSYMDHPLGQAYAAFQAGLMLEKFPAVVKTCGLMTHGLFESNDFSERLGEVQPEWQYTGGTGLGSDDLLENLEWEKVSI